MVSVIVKRGKTWSENVLKGRISECIVEEMLKESGYCVYRFGYEGILQNLTQLNIDLKKTDTKDKITTMPDFLIVDSKGDMTFIEVKFRAKAKSYISKDKKRHAILEKHWNKGYIILVSLDEDIFSLMSLSKEWMNYAPIFPDWVFNLSEDILNKYKDLVVEYLGKK